MPSSLFLCLKQKEAQLNLFSLVREKAFFDTPISTITRKFYGKGEQFGDETLGKTQIGI